ncbi:MAG: hypothetical protein GXO43_07705 [Crenarchaeota archaeon]|nr:hypothetical protein [Thermoproteota archaeon]
MTCVEKARAIARAWEALGLSNRTEYILWISWNGAFHLSPVDTDNMQVLEQGTENYHQLGFTPIIVLPTCPWGTLTSIRLDPHEAYNLPTIPIDRKIKILAKLGYGKIKKNPRTHEHLDTGIAKIYRITGEKNHGILAWFKTDDIFIIAKDPYDHLTTAINNMNKTPPDYWPNR